LSLLPAFQVIQLFKSLSHLLQFPVFLALKSQDHFTSASLQVPFPSGVGIIHAMKVFMDYAKDAQKRSQTTSNTLKYACHNWVSHSLQAPKPWDNMLNCLFKSFWNHHLLSWLEWQWCLNGLQSCLSILSKGQNLVKVCSLPMIARTRALTI
jgi:hypothetical protein